MGVYDIHRLGHQLPAEVLFHVQPGDLVERPVQVHITPQFTDSGVAREPGVVPGAARGSILARHPEYPEVECPEVEYYSGDYARFADSTCIRELGCYVDLNGSFYEVPRLDVEQNFRWELMAQLVDDI